MTADLCRCDKCRRAFDIDDLDAKPRMDLRLFLIWLIDGQSRMLRYAADHGYDFTQLECRACYGIDYASARP